MNLIDYTTTWAKGDIVQGRIMFGLGILLLIGAIFILRGNNDFLKGMLIPIALMLVVNLGYGGFLAFGRGAHILMVEKALQEDQTKAIEAEIAKAEKDGKSYSLLVQVWPIIIILAIGLFFIASGEYWKGLSIGIICLFGAMMIIDSLLHQRLKPYLEALNGM